MYLELPRLIHEISQLSTRFVEQYVAFAFEPNTRQIVIRNMKVKRFESNLVPLWVLDDGGPFALAHSKLRTNESADVISISSGQSVMKGPSSAVPLME